MAALMLLIAGYCVVRLVAGFWGPATDRVGTAVHVLMGLVMAGMYAPAVMPPVPILVWQVCFAMIAAGFLGMSLARHGGERFGGRSGDHRDHGASSLAMVVMLVPVPGAPLALVQVIVVGLTAGLVLGAARSAHAALTSVRELSAVVPSPGPVTWLLAPSWPRCCEAAMSLAMAVMLFMTV